MDQAKAEQLLATLEERGVRRVKLGGVDIDGILRGKYVSLDKLRSVLTTGFGFCDVIFGWDVADALYDRPSVTGWQTGFPDAHAEIDPETLRFPPWEPGTATLLVDFRAADGSDHPACPRSLLRRVRDRAREMGYDEVRFACELEFFLFKETPDTLQAKDFRDLTPLTPGMYGYSWVRAGQSRELVVDILEGMRAYDIEVEGLHTETGPGVYEAAIRYDDVLSAADKAVLFKVAMKQIAREHDLSVSFMAKWNASLPGCSGHLHQSLWLEGDNVFYNRVTPGEPSALLGHYVGGQCLLMPELTALVSPNVNSYKRYVPGVWAPLTASWGVENRTAALRVIGLDSPGAARVEHRQPASDLNPYIAMATTLAAGLYGIKHHIELPKPVTGDASAVGLALPRSLGDATQRLRASQRAKKLLGEAFVDHYCHTREWEVRQYEKAVTDWELRRYFEGA